MRKIPTLFRRDREDMRRLLPVVHPDCQWVLDGEGTPTRKYDGTCLSYDGTRWAARREVKPGKTWPENFEEIETDPATGKTVGWEAIEGSPFFKYAREALVPLIGRPWSLSVGTYELCGPKINGNPEGYDRHVLISHAEADEIKDAPRDFDGLRAFLADFPHEGIVWHHPDGRMAKVKRRDCPS